MGRAAPPSVIGRPAPRRSAALAVLPIAAGGLFVALLVLPMLGLVMRIPPGELLGRLAKPFILQALWLSLKTSLASTAAVAILGLPVAYLLAMRQFPGKRLLEVLVDLPMVLPPTVAGVGLLLAFGRTGLVGRELAAVGITIPFTSLAVVLAQMFVAGPLLVNAARAGFEQVDAKYLRAAATLRASSAHTFLRVVLPLSLPSLSAGAAMTWARALGEFGATITFAGNLPGRTQTMPLAVYEALQSDLEAAVALSVMLLVVSFGVLFALRNLPRASWR
ncbi:MAG TPA: ABC transporter permease [bacterium]|nr:ABC transporter permease [bacterium]